MNAPPLRPVIAPPLPPRRPRSNHWPVAIGLVAAAVLIFLAGAVLMLARWGDGASAASASSSKGLPPAVVEWLDEHFVNYVVVAARVKKAGSEPDHDYDDYVVRIGQKDGGIGTVVYRFSVRGGKVTRAQDWVWLDESYGFEKVEVSP
jgi:hypothetical protein